MNKGKRKEIFKTLTDNIEISNFGRVKKNGKIQKINVSTNGYSVIRIKGKQKYIHRLVLKLFIYNDNPKEKTQVNHIDFNRTNNAIDNLEWVTQSENELHKRTKGLYKNKDFFFIGQYNQEGLLEKIFLGLLELLKANNISVQSIKQHLNGETHSLGKKLWKKILPNNIIHKIPAYSGEKVFRDGKKISSYNLKGIKEKTFNSLSELLKYYSISASTIHGAINNRKGSLLLASKFFRYGEDQKINVDVPENVLRRYYKIAIKNEEIFKIFDKKKEALSFLNVQTQTISKCCLGETKTVKGFEVKYIKE